MLTERLYVGTRAWLRTGGVREPDAWQIHRTGSAYPPLRECSTTMSDRDLQLRAAVSVSMDG